MELGTPMAGVFIVFCIFIYILKKIAQAKKICWLGFHDKEMVAELHIADYIGSILTEYNDDFKRMTHPEIDRWKREIFKYLYIQNTYRHNTDFWMETFHAYDYVCVKCLNKCFYNIEHEKTKIKRHIAKVVDNEKKIQERKTLAKKIYGDNCQGGKRADVKRSTVGVK